MFLDIGDPSESSIDALNDVASYDKRRLGCPIFDKLTLLSSGYTLFALKTLSIVFTKLSRKAVSL